MSSEAPSKPAPPDRALVDEIDTLIGKIKTLHTAENRVIANKMKRARKGRVQLAVLETLGMEIPEDLRALYWNWNGAEGTGRMSHWDEEVFFNYKWLAADMLVDIFRIATLEEHRYATSAIRIGIGWRVDDLALFADSKKAGLPELAVTRHHSKCIYFAFDGIVAMLRSVVAAHEAGIVSYAPERVTNDQGRKLVEQNQTQYDPAALWEVIAPLNPRTAAAENNYWTARATDTLEFDGTPPKGIKMKPEVQAIVFRDLIAAKKRKEEELARKLSDG